LTDRRARPVSRTELMRVHFRPAQLTVADGRFPVLPFDRHPLQYPLYCVIVERVEARYKS
jgi:hypothetical protein